MYYILSEYLLKNTHLEKKLLNTFNNWKVAQLVGRWKSDDDTKRYVDSYKVCQRNNASYYQKYELLQSL